MKNIIHNLPLFLFNITRFSAIVTSALVPLHTMAAEGDIPSGDIAFAFSFSNPLRSDIESIPALIREILNIAVAIGVPVAVLAIVYSGFLFVSSRGDVKKLDEAKKIFFYAVIGAAILLGAYIIALAIQNTVNQLGAAS